MKKLLIFGAILSCSLSFASNSLNKKVVEENMSKENETKMETLLQVLLRNRIWSVTFQTSCGTTTNVAFESNYEDGTPEFIQDLADAVNWADSICDE